MRDWEAEGRRRQAEAAALPEPDPEPRPEPRRLGIAARQEAGRAFDASMRAAIAAALAEVVEEFGGDAARMIDDPEGADVSIRCHLLRRAIDMALDELAEDVVAGEYSPRLAGTEA